MSLGFLCAGIQGWTEGHFLRPKQKPKQKQKNLLPSAEGRSRRFKNQLFLPKKIEEHLFIMLLKLVISTLPYNTIDYSFENDKLFDKTKR